MAPWLTTLGIFGKDPSSVASPHVGGGGGLTTCKQKSLKKGKYPNHFLAFFEEANFMSLLTYHMQ